MTTMHRDLAVRIAISMALVSLASGSLLAQRERYAPLVLQLPTSARTLALGGAGVAQQDMDAVFINPALVSDPTTMAVTLARFSPSASAGSLATTAKYGHVSFGLGVQYLDYSRNTFRFPISSGDLSIGGPNPASSLAATVAASLAWKGMRWGVATKYVEERAALARDGALAFDVGASKDLPFANLTSALVVQNMGPSLSMLGQRAALPARASLGLQGGGYSLGAWLDAGFVAQLAVRRDGVVLPAAGAELSFEALEGVSFIARAGARRAELKEERPLTLGAGFSLDRFAIDYAWEQLRASGGAHRVTLRLR